MISLSIVKSLYTFDEIDFKFGNIVGYEVDLLCSRHWTNRDPITSGCII